MTSALPTPSPNKLPRWRGFNLLEKYRFDVGNRAYSQRDFELIAGWGFNFVRLPIDVGCLLDPTNPRRPNQTALNEIDQAIQWGQQYGIHVNLAFYRLHGYCVAADNAPPQFCASDCAVQGLWSSRSLLNKSKDAWILLADRYKSYSNSQLTYNLINEPPDMRDPRPYVSVVEALAKAIRVKDPNRLIIADGLAFGRKPVPEITRRVANIAQSTRGYDPFYLTHYKASWIRNRTWGVPPRWPVPPPQRTSDPPREEVYDKASHFQKRVRPWQEKLKAQQQVGVHVGEWGACHGTPRRLKLAWMKDMLENWKDADWGWALWRLRGESGILDKGHREPNATYDSVDGWDLDRDVLDLLKAY